MNIKKLSTYTKTKNQELQPNGIKPNGIKPNGIQSNGIRPNVTKHDGTESSR